MARLSNGYRRLTSPNRILTTPWRNSSKVFFVILFLACLIGVSYIGAHYRTYGPYEFVSNVNRKANRGNRSTQLPLFNTESLHLQLPDIKSFSSNSDWPIYSRIPRCSVLPVPEAPFLNITINTNLSCRANLNGFIIENGSPTGKLSAVIQTGMILELSSVVRNDLAAYFPDFTENMYIISPAMAFNKHEEEVAVVSRIWLNKERIYINGNSLGNDTLYDNYLFKVPFTSKLHYDFHGSLLRVNVPKLKKALSGDGPMDPKLVFYKHSMHVIFNAAVENDKLEMEDRMFVHIASQGPDAVFQLLIESYELAKSDKGWVPLITVDGRYFFIYRFDPLTIIECDPNDFRKPCRFVTSQGKSYFPDKSIHLRGGTPFVEYMHPYYVAVCHGTFFIDKGTRYYTSNLVLLNIQSHSLVYVSSDISFSSNLFKIAQPARPWVTGFPFFFPVGIDVWNKDILIVSGHFNDAFSAIVKISGIKQIFDVAISTDLKSVHEVLPVPDNSNNFMLNNVLLQQLTNETGLAFLTD